MTERVADLVGRLTNEEKAALLSGRSSAAVPRMGIPLFCWGQNAIDNVAQPGTTQFPVPVGLAATFNDSLIESMAATFAVEARAQFNKAGWKPSSGYHCAGSVVTWGPTINLARDPRWLS